jgi:hypothetical protein
MLHCSIALATPPVTQLALITPPILPALVIAAGERASIRFLEFFAAYIRNPHTRRGYYRAGGAIPGLVRDHWPVVGRLRSAAISTASSMRDLFQGQLVGARPVERNRRRDDDHRSADE